MKGLRARVIVNTSAGGNLDESQRLALSEIFSSAGATLDIALAATADEARELSLAAAEGCCDLIVAGGGDGTVNIVASALVGTDKRLGILPLGTLNHFAKDLRIPLNLEAAAQNLLSGSAVRVDVAEVNGRIFLNNSSLGLYPTIVRERQKQQRLGSGKWSAFVWATLTALRRYPFVDVRVQADGEAFARKTPFVFVGNNAYVMDLFDIGRRARLDAGELSLYIINRTGRVGLLLLALRALFGRLRDDKDFLSMRTQQLTINTRRARARVALDGEVDVLQTPLEYRVLPRALSVIVPHEQSG